MNTHISYQTAKALKEFCPELPEPMSVAFWKIMILATGTPGPVFRDRDSWYNGKLDCWAYQLHDLLSRPFCEAMWKMLPIETHLKTEFSVGKTIWESYYDGGLPAVEAALLEMIGGK